MFLSKAKAQKIHEAAVTLLERTGVEIDHEEGEALLLDAGAKKEDGRILIPRDMVEEALSNSNPKIQMYNREGKKSLDLKMGNTYFGPGSDALFNVDQYGGYIRPSILADVRTNVHIADALPEFQFIMSMALPSEVEPHKLYPTVFAEMAQHTTKPLVVTATSLEDIQHIHRLGCIIAGDEAVLRQKPFFIAYLEPNFPFTMDRSSIERLLYCAEYEIPFAYAAGANCGAAAPVTLAGAVAQGTAESLAGLVLALCKHDNVRFIFGANSSSADMVTGKVLYGAPEWFKTVGMYADMGDYYNLPAWGTAGGSDALGVDGQSGMEAYEGIVLGVQSGATLIHDVGFLAYGTLYDARMLKFTNDMLVRARHLVSEVDVDSDHLALDVINDVAKRLDGYKTFFEHPHTVQYFRSSLWRAPSYLSRNLIDSSQIHTDPKDGLSLEIVKILQNHKVKELDHSIVSSITEYLNSIVVETDVSTVESYNGRTGVPAGFAQRIVEQASPPVSPHRG